eukprot:9496195-Pyramimonas_sp.AAC.1
MMVATKPACQRGWSNPHNSASTELGSGNGRGPQMPCSTSRASAAHCSAAQPPRPRSPKPLTEPSETSAPLSSAPAPSTIQ